MGNCIGFLDHVYSKVTPSATINYIDAIRSALKWLKTNPQVCNRLRNRVMRVNNAVKIYKQQMLKEVKQGVQPVRTEKRDQDSLEKYGKWLTLNELHALKNFLYDRWVYALQYIRLNGSADGLSYETFKFLVLYPVITYFCSKADRSGSAIGFKKKYFPELKQSEINGEVYFTYLTNRFKTSAKFGKNAVCFNKHEHEIMSEWLYEVRPALFPNSESVPSVLVTVTGGVATNRPLNDGLSYLPLKWLGKETNVTSLRKETENIGMNLTEEKRLILNRSMTHDRMIYFFYIYIYMHNILIRIYI